jgi:hypothetical protein
MQVQIGNQTLVWGTPASPTPVCLTPADMVPGRKGVFPFTYVETNTHPDALIPVGPYYRNQVSLPLSLSLPPSLVHVRGDQHAPGRAHPRGALLPQPSEYMVLPPCPSPCLWFSVKEDKETGSRCCNRCTLFYGPLSRQRVRKVVRA